MFRVHLREAQSRLPNHLRWGHPVQVGRHCTGTLDVMLGRSGQEKAVDGASSEDENIDLVKSLVKPTGRLTRNSVQARLPFTDSSQGVKGGLLSRILPKRKRNTVKNLLAERDSNKDKDTFVAETQIDSNTNSDDDFVVLRRKTTSRNDGTPKEIVIPETQFIASDEEQEYEGDTKPLEDNMAMDNKDNAERQEDAQSPDKVNGGKKYVSPSPSKSSPKVETSPGTQDFNTTPMLFQDTPGTASSPNTQSASGFLQRIRDTGNKLILKVLPRSSLLLDNDAKAKLEKLNEQRLQSPRAQSVSGRSSLANDLSFAQTPGNQVNPTSPRNATFTRGMGGSPQLFSTPIPTPVFSKSDAKAGEKKQPEVKPDTQDWIFELPPVRTGYKPKLCRRGGTKRGTATMATAGSGVESAGLGNELGGGGDWRASGSKKMGKRRRVEENEDREEEPEEETTEETEAKETKVFIMFIWW